MRQSIDWKAKALEYEFMMDHQRQATGEALRVLQYTLEDVRLTVKWLTHDLESTRRERDALAAKLDSLS